MVGTPKCRCTNVASTECPLEQHREFAQRHDDPAAIMAFIEATTPPRQFHVRLDEEAAAAVRDRAVAMDVSNSEWITRAVLHALEHAKANGEPPPLQLPWSALL